MPLPQTKKQLRSFLGTVSFYRKFIPNFSNIVTPANALLRKFSSNNLQWTNEQTEKMMLQRMTGASATGLGAVLLQDYNDVLMPIANDRLKKYEKW